MYKYKLVIPRGRFNRRSVVGVHSLEQVSVMWNLLRDEWEKEVGADVRASEYPNGVVLDEHGDPIGFVSWNGRVWSRCGDTLLQESVRMEAVRPSEDTRTRGSPHA